MTTHKTRSFLMFALAGLLAPAYASAAPASQPPAAAAPAAQAAAGIADKTDVIVVTLTNPLAVKRAAETIALALADLVKVVPGLELKKLQVVDAKGKLVLSQLVDSDGDETPDEIVFQTDLAPSESKAFKLRVGERASAVEATTRLTVVSCASATTTSRGRTTSSPTACTGLTWKPARRSL